MSVLISHQIWRERERGKNTHRRSIKLQSQYLSSVCYLSVLVVCHDKSPTVSECHQIRLWRLWRWTREEKEEETDCVWVCVAESCWAKHGWSLTSHTRPLMSFWSASDSTRWVPPQCTQRGDQGSELRLGQAISVGRMSYRKARCYAEAGLIPQSGKGFILPESSRQNWSEPWLTFACNLIYILFFFNVVSSLSVPFTIIMQA